MTMAVGAETVVQKICPLPCELSFITKNIPCPEEGCKSTFLNSSNLEMHLIKHHKKRSDFCNGRRGLDGMNCQYHCPVEKCLYNINSDRHFTNIKYLKQHYLKVHAEKKFLCKKCEKGFSTEAACNVHTRICGLKFTCSCGCNYMSYEALLTHAKRKNHTFDANVKLWAKGGQSAPPDASPQLIIPVAMRPAAVDVGVQTERPSVGPGRRAVARRSSAQTQTWSVKRSCAGTQTHGDYILKRAMRAAQIPVEGQVRRKRKKSMETQTAAAAAASSPPWGPKHSGTQTPAPDKGLFLDDSPPGSPPRFDPMLPGVVGSSSSRPAETQTESALSHIETQTNTEDFLLFEHLLHANMCTQTCEEEETSLFSELGFSDIQTQTVADESLWREDSSMSWSTALVSTETQTAGHCSWMSETSHMETQTDVDELRRLIAELTKHDIEGE